MIIIHLDSSVTLFPPKYNQKRTEKLKNGERSINHASGNYWNHMNHWYLQNGVCLGPFAHSKLWSYALASKLAKMYSREKNRHYMWPVWSLDHRAMNEYTTGMSCWLLYHCPKKLENHQFWLRGLVYSFVTPFDNACLNHMKTLYSRCNW